MMWWASWMIGCGGPPETPPLADATEVVGTWSGTLNAGGTPLRLVVHLTATDGAVSGTLDSVDQGATGIPLTEVAATAEGLAFVVPTVHGKYAGTWTTPGHLAGTWTQGGSTLALNLTRGEAPPPAKRPQDPVPPFPYAERALDVDSAPGVKLAGTLTVPPGDGRHPAVVLVTGSGPQDRDEALMGHRPFLVLADALARAGVVVYRYDDRGVGKSTGGFATATTNDFANDAAAAVRAVAALPEVDPARVGVLGHSEGALAAVLAASEAPVGFVVLLAGPGLPGKAIVESQVEAGSRAAGASEAVARQNREVQARLLDVIVRGGSRDDLAAEMRKVGIPQDAIPGQAGVMTSAWYRTFLALDPAPALAALKIPVLALLGDRDTQVVAAENAPALRAALAGNPAATVTVFPGLNHLFQPATTGAVSEYAAIETTIDPAVLTAITGWITTQRSTGASPP